MALKVTKELDSGIVVEDAYCRVSSIGSLDKEIMIVVIQHSIDSTSKAFTINSISIPYDIEGENPIAQAYEHLKTLPEYSDAVDC